MALGRKKDDDGAGEAGDGHYAVDMIRVDTPKRLANLLNERWANGWRFIRTEEGPGGLLVFFERAA